MDEKQYRENQTGYDKDTRIFDTLTPQKSL